MVRVFGWLVRHIPGHVVHAQPVPVVRQVLDSEDGVKAGLAGRDGARAVEEGAPCADDGQHGDVPVLTFDLDHVDAALPVLRVAGG
jgi:hypothetical protein